MTTRKRLPKGWRWAKLEDTLSLFDSGAWGKDPVEGGVPVLRSNNIQENRFLFDSDVALRDVPAKKIDRYRLQYGDIVMVKSSGSKKHIGKCAIYEVEEGQTHLFANFTQRLRANTSVIDPFYLYFYLTSDFARDALEQMHATSSGLRNIQPKVYAQQSIPLPPLAEQERIVEVLRQADAIRRKRAEARRLADQILPALFLDMFGDPATNPNKWPIRTIGDCTSLVTSGYTPRGGAASYINDGPLLIRSQNVRMLSLDLHDCAHLPETVFDAMARVRVLPGDCLLNITGASIGRTAYVNEDIPPAVVNQHVCIIRPHNDALTAEFLSYLLSMPLYQHIIQNSPGSAQSGFNHQRVRSLEVPVPPTPLQRSFSAHISYIQENFADFTSIDTTSNSLFSVLLSRAFTGDLTAE